jgi:hypothetical protein
MAVLINNARVDEQIYEFGVEYRDDKVVLRQDYDGAKKLAKTTKGKLKMRCVYKTEWLDAK